MSIYTKVKKFVDDGGGSKLNKALSSGAGSGLALIHEYLDEAITNEIVVNNPEFAFIKPKKIVSNAHKSKARKTRASTGGAMGEGATTASSASTYDQPEVALKVIRRKPKVTDFLRDATADKMDAFAQEVEVAVQEQAESILLYNYSGNATADGYQYDGWDKRIATNRNGRFDGFNSGTGVAEVPDIKLFDAMIDASKRKNKILSDKVFLMTQEMNSLLSRLSRDVIRVGVPLGKVEIAGGHEVETYRGVPILNSSMLPGVSSETMGTVTAVAGGGAGNLSDDDYFFRVMALLPDGGETQASAESAVTLSGATAVQSIDMSWTAVPNAIGYKVFHSETTGLSAMTVIRWIAAKTYDADGTITGDVTGLTLINIAADSSVSGLEADKPLVPEASVNAENVYLIDFSEVYGMGRFAHNNAGSAGEGIISMEPLGKQDAFLEMLVWTHGAMIPKFEASCVKASGWRNQ